MNSTARKDSNALGGQLDGFALAVGAHEARLALVAVNTGPVAVGRVAVALARARDLVARALARARTAVVALRAVEAELAQVRYVGCLTSQVSQRCLSL